jgi:hypothetical protein
MYPHMSNDEARKSRGRTVLHAIGTPLVLGDFAKDRGAMIKQLIHDAIFRFCLQVLERVLGAQEGIRS